MTADRTRWLLDREQDGELTDTERAELERLCRLDPNARRSRDGWSRVAEAMGEGYAAPDPAALQRAAKALRARLDEPSPRRWDWLRVPVLAGALLAVVAVASNRPDEPKAMVAPAAVSMQGLPVEEVQPERAPVELNLGEGLRTAKANSAPVTIQF